MNTFRMSEIDLRHLQLSEVRAMLGLPIDATHELVIHYLLRRTGNTEAVPQRYRDSMWFNQGVWLTPEERERPIKLEPTVTESNLWMEQSKKLFLALMGAIAFTVLVWGLCR